MKTIKELTELTGVSKVSIYNLINKKSLKQYTFKKNGITYIDDIGTNFIVAYYSSEQQHTLNNIIQEDI